MNRFSGLKPMVVDGATLTSFVRDSMSRGAWRDIVPVLPELNLKSLQLVADRQAHLEGDSEKGLHDVVGPDPGGSVGGDGSDGSTGLEQ